MTRILFSLAVTLAAYTDTLVGLRLRSAMVELVDLVDPDLAAYVVFDLHF